MPLHAIMERIRSDAERHGLGPTLGVVARKALDRAIGLRVLRGVVVRHADPAYLRCHTPYDARFLLPEEVWRHASDAANELPRRFVDEALARGDECYAITAGDALAAYGWYTRRPSALDLHGLELRFDPAYVYMYKGFTRPEHRGQRLHGIGMTRALEHYLRHGRLGLVSYVEATNLDSMRSIERMGYACFGSVYLAKPFGRWLAHASAGCAAYGFEIRATAVPTRAPTRAPDTRSAAPR